MTSLDLEDQIRAWTDAAVELVAPVAADEVWSRPVQRPRPSRRRSVWLAAAAVVVVGVALAALLAIQGSDEEDVATTTEGTGEVVFEVLGVSEGSGESHLVLRSASTDAGVADLWAGARLEGPVPAVDLTDSAVVSITISDDLCPPTLDRFERTGPDDWPILTPVFVEPPGSCEEPEVARTYVVAISWASTSSSFRVRAPASDAGLGFDRILDVQSPAPPNPAMAGLAVWPIGATTADRSTAEATARSFVASLLGDVPVTVSTSSSSGPSEEDGPTAVEVDLGSISTTILVAPAPDGWIVMQAGGSLLSIGVDEPIAGIQTVPGAVTIELIITTDQGVTAIVEDAVDPQADVGLPPGTVSTIAAIHRSEDGTLLALTAGHF